MELFKKRKKDIPVRASGYSDAGGSTKKRSLKAFKAQSLSPREDIDYSNATLRQRGRMLYMSSPIAAGAINTNRTKGVGSGLHCKPTVNYKFLGMSEDAAYEWQQRTEAEFRLWAESRDCDVLGLNNFYELQQLALMSWLMSGDTFVLLKRAKKTPLMPYTLRLHLIEADRVCTPSKFGGKSINLTDGKNTVTGNEIFDGVEVDKNGKVAAYHICSAYPNSYAAKKLEWQRVEAVGKKTGLPNILQLYTAERPEQYRGVTYLAPVIEIILQQRRYTEAELTSAIIQAYFTGWITTHSIDAQGNPLFGSSVGEPVAAGENTEQNDTVYEPEYQMAPGNIAHLQEGEDIRFGNPNIPTAGFETFIKSLNVMAGAALEIPYDVLMKEFNSSYSAAKGALEEAAETVKMRRSWFVSDFCQPIYEVWLAEAVAEGRIKAPGFFSDPLIRKAWSGTRWDGPAQTHLDPVKEAQANEILVQNGWKTNEQVTREYYGGNWQENADIIKRERGKLPPEEVKNA